LFLLVVSFLNHFLNFESNPFLSLALSLSYQFLIVILSVRIHRFVLLKEDFDNQLQWKWTRREWRYFWKAFQVGIIVSLPAYFVILVSGIDIEKMPEVIIYLLSFITICLYACFALVFPSIAVDLNVSLKWSYDMTSGITFKLIYLIFLLPVSVVFLREFLNDFVGIQIICISVYLTLYSISLFFLSFAYQIIFPDY